MSEFNKYRKFIDCFAIDIERNLEVEILGSQEDFVFQERYFFDSIYHLNAEGRSLQTKKIIKLIKDNNNLSNYIKKVRTSIPAKFNTNYH